MPMRSLLLCGHVATSQFVSRGFKEFSIDVESYSEPQAALQTLKDQRFEAIVVDAEDRAGATLILDSLKDLPTCKNSLKIVLADRQTALGAAFSTGTHLVIYKPISADRLRNSLRALSNLMGRRHPREFGRIQVRVPAIVHTPGKNLPASILDISQGGLALLAKEVIPAVKTLGGGVCITRQDGNGHNVGRSDVERCSRSNRSSVCEHGPGAPQADMRMGCRSA